MVNRNIEFIAALGKAVSDRRKKLGLSQNELSVRCGVDRAFLSNVESGARNPSLGVIASIAEGLKISLPRLFIKVEEILKHRGLPKNFDESEV